MSFLHSHLVYSSLSIVLLSLGQGRVSIAVWWCSHSLSWGGRLMPIGTLEGHVTWLSTVKACLNCFHWCCTIDTWGPLRTLIPSVWSLVTIGTRSHLVLRGHKSLSSRLGSLLKVLLHRLGCGSSRQRTKMRSVAAAVLTLMLLLALVLQYSFPVL
jgi:hypothetical protein